MRVLLCYKCSEDGSSDFFERILPIGVCSLHSVLTALGHTSFVANLSNTSWRAIAKLLVERNPDLVGISTFTFNRHVSLRLAAEVKKRLPGAAVVLGGPHASHVPEAILRENPAVDYIVLGEGEDTLAALAAALAEGRDAGTVRGIVFRRGAEIVSTGWPEPIADLDRLPAPSESFEGHGVDPRTQFMYLITSRGCPARCTFCNTPEFWGTRIRFRSVDHVLSEMRRLRDEYGLLYLSVRDDTFTAQRGRILELCRRMQEERLYFLWDCQSRVNAVDEERLDALRRAGCVHIQYGVESGATRILGLLNKDIRVSQIEEAARLTRQAGLVFSVYLIGGVAGETEQDLRETEELLARIRPHDAMVSPLAVFPGTALWTDWKKAHGLDDSYWGSGSREDIYVRAGDPAAEASIARIGGAVERVAPEAAYTLDDYREQRRRIGDCHAIDLAEADLHLCEGDALAALHTLEALARREPDNPWAHLRIGQLHLDLRRPAHAAPALDRLVELVPRFAEGHALLARALNGCGRRSEAAQRYAQALALDPGHATASRALRRLGVIEASAHLAPAARRRAAFVRN